MPLTSSDIAALREAIEHGADQHSLRFVAASIAMHGLLASGVAERVAADKVAAVAYDCAEAFLTETMRRLLPEGSFGTG